MKTKTFVALSSLAIAMAAAASACSSSSSGSSSPEDGGNSSGGATDGGSSSGASSSGSTSSGASGGGSSGTVGSSTSSGSSSSGAGTEAGDPGGTALITGLSKAPRGLTVSGSNLYFVEPNVGVESVPLAGGAPTVVAPNMQVAGSLATDGTALYFDVQNPNDSLAQDILSAPIGGGTATPLATGTVVESIVSGDDGNHMFVLGGNVYTSGGVGPAIMPKSGGTPAVFSGGLSGSILEMLWVDSSGAYFTVNGTFDDAGASPYFGFAPLPGVDGGTVANSSIGAPTSSFAEVYAWGGDFIVVNGVAYYVDGGQDAAALYKSSPPSGPATMVATLTGLKNCSLVGDANGGYVTQGTGSSTSIYSVNLTTGATAIFVSGTDNGNPVQLAATLDAHNLYYSTAGTSGMYAIYAKAR